MRAIYAIEHCSGKAYIGSAVNVSRRWSEHASALRTGRHHNAKLQAAWNKHGPGAFFFRVLEQVADSTELLPREQAWLDKEQPYYNIVKVAAAAMSGRRHSSETRAKIGAANTGRRHFGRPVSAETRRKLSESAVGNRHCAGRKLSAEHRASLVGNQHGRGYRHTAEAKARMAATRTGQKRGQYKRALEDN